MVLGKFLPPHAGHIHLIRAAQSQCEHLTVLVCSIQKEPIPGEKRFAWMKELFPDPDLQLIHVTDEVPQAPEESDEFWPIWKEIIRRSTPQGLDVVFTSENYGDDIAYHLACWHELVDLPREKFPVSGTLVREEPFAHWEYIPKPVRPWFVKRIALVGPESTGKSTLSKQLAAHFKAGYVEEFAREYMEWGSRPLELTDITEIGRGQAQWEDQAAREADKLLFCDTNLLSTVVWSELYFGEAPEWVIEESKSRKYTLHLLLKPDIPWDDDGTRAFPERAAWHFLRLKEELTLRGESFVIISGQGEIRLQNAIAAVEKLLQGEK